MAHLGGIPLGENDEVIFHLENDYIGNPDAGQFWENQGQNGTCAIGAVSGALRALGFLDYDAGELTIDAIIAAASVLVDENGNIITNPLDLPGVSFVPAGSSFGTVDGRTITVEEDSYLDPFGDHVPKLDGFIKHEGEPLYHTRVITGYQRYNGVDYPTYGFRTGPNENVGIGWGIIPNMLDYYGATNDTVYFDSFPDLVKTLQEGKPVIAFVDATNELWQDPDFIREIQDETDTPYIDTTHQDSGRYGSGENHAIWITGIDLTVDPPVFIINDTGPLSGRSARYDARHFLSAWEDAEFIATVVGGVPDIVNLSNRSYDLGKRMADAVFFEDVLDNVSPDTHSEIIDDDGLISLDFINHLTPSNLLEYDLDLIIEIVDAIEEIDPGFKADYAQWAEDSVQAQLDVIEELGLDPDTLKLIDEIKAEILDE